MVSSSQKATAVIAISDGALDSNAFVVSERQLSFFRNSVQALFEQFGRENWDIDAQQAYDCGLTSGFYGKESAIAQGFRRWLAKRLRDLRASGTAKEQRRRIALVRRVGMAHGQLICAGCRAVKPLGEYPMSEGEAQTYTDLMHQRQALVEQIEAARESEVGQVIADIIKTMETYAITLDELRNALSRVQRQKRRGKPAEREAKYRDAVTGRTWNGIGRPPKWLQSGERKP